MAYLELRQISKHFDTTPVLRNINLNVEQGEILCILGPSGCGKTTLLRIIAGLESPDKGTLTIRGVDIRPLSPHKRGIGMMFQDFALFPHRDVYGNIAFGLRMQNLPRDEIDRRVRAMLELVHLQGFEHREIHSLSGGEQQRVALARALAPNPRLLLLDEPMGSLDRTLRDRLVDELRSMLKELRMTSIYVTHDQAEAFAIADHVALMHNGEIIQTGTPEEVYHHPATPWAARFLGMTNFLPGTVIDRQEDTVQVETPLGRLTVPHRGPAPSQVTLLIRPEAGTLSPLPDAPKATGTIKDSTFRGGWTTITLAISPILQLRFDLPTMSTYSLRPNTTLTLHIRPEGILLFPEPPLEEKR